MIAATRPFFVTVCGRAAACSRTALNLAFASATVHVSFGVSGCGFGEVVIVVSIVT